jgi:ABC-type branched-subunit amino acid transport system permease subunit
LTEESVTPELLMERSSGTEFALFALGVFALLSLFIVHLRRSTTGLALSSVRWSETARHARRG